MPWAIDRRVRAIDEHDIAGVKSDSDRVDRDQRDAEAGGHGLSDRAVGSQDHPRRVDAELGEELVSCITGAGAGFAEQPRGGAEAGQLLAARPRRRLVGPPDDDERVACPTEHLCRDRRRGTSGDDQIGLEVAQRAPDLGAVADSQRHAGVRLRAPECGEQRKQLDTWGDVTFDYESTDTPDVVPTPS